MWWTCSREMISLAMIESDGATKRRSTVEPAVASISSALSDTLSSAAKELRLDEESYSERSMSIW